MLPDLLCHKGLEGRGFSACEDVVTFMTGMTWWKSNVFCLNVLFSGGAALKHEQTHVQLNKPCQFEDPKSENAPGKRRNAHGSVKGPLGYQLAPFQPVYRARERVWIVAVGI
jgi:hypothetical protein